MLHSHRQPFLALSIESAQPFLALSIESAVHKKHKEFALSIAVQHRDFCTVSSVPCTNSPSFKANDSNYVFKMLIVKVVAT